MQNRLIDVINTQLHFFAFSTLLYHTLHIAVIREEWVAKYPLHITETRERYILDKTYWLVSSFNGNVVPLNGVRGELKKRREKQGDEV